MKLALTLLLVGIAQSQTLLNTLRNLGADDSSILDGTSTGTYLTPNIMEKLPRLSTETIKAIDAKFADDIKDIYAKAAAKKKSLDAETAEKRKALYAETAQKRKALYAETAEKKNAKFADDIKDIYAKAAAKKKAIDAKIAANTAEKKKAIDAKVEEDIKYKYAEADAKKKEIYERELNTTESPLLKLLMQEPKGDPGFTSIEFVVNSFKKLGALNYQKLVDDGIVQEPTQPVSIKLNFKRDFGFGIPAFFEFAQVNSDDQLHGFARFSSSSGTVIEGEFRNGMMHGFQRYLLNRDLSNKIAYFINWSQNNYNKGYLQYSIVQDTPIYEVQYGLMNEKNKKAFAKIKKNGPKSYFL